MPVANACSSSSKSVSRSNLAYDANRRRMVHGPLQPMDADIAPAGLLIRGLWNRLLRG